MDGGNVIFNFEGDDSKLKSMVSTLGSGVVKSTKIAVAGITAVSTAMVGLIGYGVKYNAEIENYTTSFEVMTSSAEKASQIVDKLKKMGAATPFEFKDLANTTNLLMSFGFESDKAISTLSMLGDISQGSADKLNTVARAFGKMSSAQKVGLEDINMMIDSGFNPLQEITESTGESMKSLYARISKGSMSVDEITKSMQRSTSVGGKYFQSMEKQSKTLNGQISTLQDNFSSLAGTIAKDTTNAITSKALPAINEWISTLNSSFETGGFEAFSKQLGTILAQVIQQLANSGPSFLNMGVNIIKNLIDGLKQNLPTIMNSFDEIIGTLISALATMFPMLLDLGLGMVTMIIEGISQAIANPTQLIINIMNFINTLKTTVMTYLPTILMLGGYIIQDLIAGMVQIFPELIPTMINMLLWVVNAILDNLDKIIDMGIQLLLALVDGIVKTIPTLIEQIPQILLKIIEAIVRNLPKIIQLGGQIIGKLAMGILGAVPGLIGQIPNIVNMLFQALWTIVTLVPNIGYNLVVGIWNGISSMGGWLWNKVTGFANNIVNTIKNALGIHSPSRVMMQLGEYVDKGFINGILGMQTDVTKAFNNTFDIAPNVTRTANTNYRANVTVNNNINSSFDSLGQVVNSVRTFANGSKNDYSYAGG